MNFDNWENIFTSRLFYLALALLALGVLVGVIAGRRTSQAFERGPSSLGPILAGFFVLSCAILASIRGTIFNNVWWVIVVDDAGDRVRPRRRRARRPGARPRTRPSR